MVHYSYSRLTLRLLLKRNKYLIVNRNLKDSYPPELVARNFSKSALLCDKYPSAVHFKSKLPNTSTPEYQISQADIILKEIKSGCFSAETLNNLKSQVFSVDGHINETNFDAIFMGHCINEKAFSIAKSFFLYLHAQGKYNLGTIGKFFRLCFDCANECTEDDKKFIEELSHDILSKHDILDFRTCENMALGLSLTSKWKVGLQLLEMCSFSALPSSKMFSTLVKAAFINREFDTGWKLLHDMAENNRQLEVDIFKTWLEVSGFTLNNYNKILQFLESYDLHPSEDLAAFLLHVYRELKKKSQHCAITSIHRSGRCQACYKKLPVAVVTEDEFIKLRDTFLNPVLLGKNIFLKTKPQEFQAFLDFLNDVGKVDVVLDGLNIAYAKNPSKFNKSAAARLLADVVRHFIEQSKKVIVIGRKHMELWPKEQMYFIKQNSSIFLADNVSQDDPLLLYATMKSGLGTFFVSRDQMRGHKFLLKNAELMSIFSRWQQIHQLHFQYVTPTGSVVLGEPLPYSLSVQKTSLSSWHIPISSPMEGVPGHLIPRKTKWLCLS